MGKTRSLAVVSEDNLISKIISSLKSFLTRKQVKQENEPLNRRAVVIEEEKIERKIKRKLTASDLNELDISISKDITKIDNLTEEDLDLLDEYYDMKINEMENILNTKKSNYYKLVSSKRA